MSFFSSAYPPPPDDDVKSIAAEGDYFLINGRRQHVRGFTDFRSFMLFARHGTISPLALQMQRIHRDFVSYKETPPGVDRDATMPGVPALSPVTTLMNPWGETEQLGVDSFDPRNDPQIFNKLDAYLTECNKRRLIPLIIVFAWTKLFAGMTLDWKRQFLRDACAVIAKHVALVSLVLEYDTGDSDINPLDFEQSPGVLISRGSGGEDKDPPQPGWGFGEVHPLRGDKWLQHIADSGWSFRRDGQWGDGRHAALTYPIINSESKGFGEPGDKGRSSDTRESFNQAVDNALWFGSYVFHSEAGTRSQELGTYQQNCAITAWRGAYAVPEVP